MFHHYMYGPGWDGGFGFDGLIFLLFCVLIALLVVVVWKRTNGFHPNWHGARDPLEYLKERYAKGEITKEEFDRIKHDLSG